MHSSQRAARAALEPPAAADAPATGTQGEFDLTTPAAPPPEDPGPKPQ
jgi:hypothetical protein